MDDKLIELKGKLEKVIDILDNAPSDTTPDRIVRRRKLLDGFNREIERVRVLVADKPLPVKNFVEELIVLFNDYFRYFETGYNATYSIDVLPQMLRNKLMLAVKKINEL